MDIEIIKENYEIQLLTENHNLSNFKSKSDDLNDFLKNDALNQQQKGLNVTNLLIYENEIIGFFSLLSDTINIKNFPTATCEYNEIPAIKIGRLAIDEKYAGHGLGTDLLDRLIKEITIISNSFIGVRFVTVDSAATAFKFYEKYGFTPFKKEEAKLEKLEKIINHNPTQTIALYWDLNKDI